ncbi:MAG TPA: histidine--tRNA ligase [Deltaproteobacteria bacterium]|nr:histidine--tRNA ligase [Deltaproteobacteria bacterium]
MEVKAIRGMNDILPDEAMRWRFVEDTTRRIFSLYGFAELRPPVMERTDLFLRGIGDETDVVEKQMYTFTDKGGESVTLRPEATACVLRAVIEHGLLGKDPIAKLYTLGPMFRYERPQKGRYRQFHQINAERLGEDGPLADAETLAMAYDLASSILGREALLMEVNSLGCKACRPAFTAALKDFLESRQDRLCADCRRRMHTNPLRVLDCKVESCREAVQDAPLMDALLCESCREHHGMVLAGLDALGVRYEQNPRLVRGLDYYTRTTFEITATGLGSQNAVAGGGRYDDLLSILGGPAVGGIGFAFGMERMIMLMGERQETASGCFVVAQGRPDIEREALAFMAELRTAGIRAEAAFGRSFKAQMRRADKAGYPLCVILGEDEVKTATLTVRDMRKASQVKVNRAAVLEEITSMLADDKGERA